MSRAWRESGELPPSRTSIDGGQGTGELPSRASWRSSDLSEGQSNKVIARNPDISDGTVKLHIKAILRKLGVHSRVEAAVMAVERGLARHAGD